MYMKVYTGSHRNFLENSISRTAMARTLHLKVKCIDSNKRSRNQTWCDWLICFKLLLTLYN